MEQNDLIIFLFPDTKIFIGGSVGPYGACQADGSEYDGKYMQYLTEKDIIDWHRPRINALIESGVDFIALETFPAASEALYVIKLLKEYPSTKFWITFSCKVRFDNLSI